MASMNPIDLKQKIKSHMYFLAHRKFYDVNIEILTIVLKTNLNTKINTKLINLFEETTEKYIGDIFFKINNN